MTTDAQDKLAAAIDELLNAEQGRLLGTLTPGSPAVKELAQALAEGMPRFLEVLEHRYGTVALVFERGEVVRIEALFTHRTRRSQR